MIQIYGHLFQYIYNREYKERQVNECKANRHKMPR